MSILKHISHPKIATKLVLSFLTIALVPLAIVSTLAYVNAKQHLIESVTSGLSATAESKVSQIERYLFERKKEVRTLSHTPTLINAMEQFNTVFEKWGIRALDDGQDYQNVDQQVRPFLTYYQKTVGFSDLFLISPKGDVVFSVNRGEDLGSNYKTGVYQNSGLAKVFNRANTQLSTEVSDFEYYAATNEPAAFIASPITKEGNLIGVVVLQLSNKEVYQVVLETIGLGTTGETVIGSAIGTNVVFVTPVRHDPYAALRREVLIGATFDIPLQEAAQGQKGDGIYLDYRGKEVLSVWRYLPSFRWGMVVKIDVDEAFAPIHNLRNLSLSIGGIAALLVIYAALVFSRTLSNPIVKLTQATQLIAAGYLTHRADTTSADEIGELAVSFNTMAARVEERTLTLAEAHEVLRASHGRLEERVTERTAELTRANKEMEAFTYTISHDLRAPVRALLGYSSILVEEYAAKLDTEGHRLLKVLQRESTHIGNMIDDLLNFSRLGHSEINRVQIDMNRFVYTVVEQLRMLEPARFLTVHILDLPPVMGDPALLQHVFSNLISNAFKYTSKNKETIVTIGSQNLHGEWVYFVADNGVGFDMRYVDKLFSVFQRLHTDSEFQGNGVGLAIVSRVIQKHKGRAWAEGKLNEGATFYVALPKD